MTYDGKQEPRCSGRRAVWLCSELKELASEPAGGCWQTHALSQPGRARQKDMADSLGPHFKQTFGDTYYGDEKEWFRKYRESRARCENMAVGVRQLAVSSRTCVGDLLSLKSDFLDFQW